MLRSQSLKSHLVAGVAIGILGAPGAAFAQAEEIGLEEVVVTARKRDERLVDVPVAVSAVTKAGLQKANVTQLSDLNRVVPTLELQKSGSGSGGSFRIRGLGSPSESGIEQTVALNFDGIVLGRGRIVRVAVFDLETVEVLKGPQALFFGKNSPGGVVSMSSANPGSEFGGYLRAGYEYRADQRFLEGGVDAPISDAWRIRLAARISEQDGWVKNTAPVSRPDPFNGPPGTLQIPRTNDRAQGITEKLARLTVVYDDGGPFTANLKVLGGLYRDNGDTEGLEVAQCAPGQSFSVTRGLADTFSDCRLDLRETQGGLAPEMAARWPEARDGHGFGKLNAGMTSLTLNYELGDVTLTSVTGYYGYKSRHFGISDASGFAIAAGSNNEFVNNYSEEIRAISNYEGPFNFTAGLFFEDNNRKYLNAGKLTNVPATPQGGLLFDPATGRSNTYVLRAKTQWRTYSAFGQLRYEIVPNLELAGGLRWTHEEKDSDLQNLFVNQAVPAVANTLKPVGQVIVGSFKDENLSPEATLTWKPRDDMTLYAAYKTGYKSGGFSNPGVLSAPFNATNLKFQSEEAKGGEVGFKFARSKLSGDLTVYSYDYDNLQVTSLDSQTLVFAIRNAASARLRGVEAQLRARPFPELTLIGSVAYNNAKFLSYPNAQCYAGQTAATGCTPGATGGTFQNLSGRRFAGAPRWTSTAGFEFARPISDKLDLALTSDVIFRSKFDTHANYDPRAPNFGNIILLNASARVSTSDGKWSLAVIGTNLTDEIWTFTVAARPTALPGELAGLAQPPRQVSMQLSYNF